MEIHLTYILYIYIYIYIYQLFERNRKINKTKLRKIKYDIKYHLKASQIISIKYLNGNKISPINIIFFVLISQIKNKFD